MEAPYNVMKIQGHLINKTLRKFMFLQFAEATTKYFDQAIDKLW